MSCSQSKPKSKRPAILDVLDTAPPCKPVFAPTPTDWTNVPKGSDDLEFMLCLLLMEARNIYGPDVTMEDAIRLSLDQTEQEKEEDARRKK